VLFTPFIGFTRQQRTSYSYGRWALKMAYSWQFYYLGICQTWSLPSVNNAGAVPRTFRSSLTLLQSPDQFLLRLITRRNARICLVLQILNPLLSELCFSLSTMPSPSSLFWLLSLIGGWSMGNVSNKHCILLPETIPIASNKQ